MIFIDFIKSFFIMLAIVIVVAIMFFVSTFIDYKLMDKYLSENSDYKVCDLNGCKYVTMYKETTCFVNNMPINCSEIQNIIVVGPNE